MTEHWITSHATELEHETDGTSWSVDYDATAETGPVVLNRDYTDGELQRLLGRDTDVDDVEMPEVSIVRSPSAAQSFAVEYTSDTEFSHPWGGQGTTRSGVNYIHESGLDLDDAVTRALQFVEQHDDKNQA